ncbi:MAG: hypothetical protein ACT4NL_06005 [Pseudomarimonas sp.]
MSYDLFIEIEAGSRFKAKRGVWPEEAMQRLERVRLCLRQLDPALELEQDDALLHGGSDTIG